MVKVSEDCKNKISVQNILFLILIFILSTQLAQQTLAKPIPLTVCILPQVYFVNRIAGDRVSVDVLVLPGKSPATYAPSPQQITKLVKSKIFFTIGLPFETVLLPKIKTIAPKLTIVKTHKGITLRKMEGDHNHSEKKHQKHFDSKIDKDQHDNKKELISQGNDPHTWLDPLLVKKQAQVIYNSLVQLDPEGKADYKTGLSLFISELDELDKNIHQTMAPVKGKTFFVFHPSFGYFADAYGLKQKAVEVEGKIPKGKDLVHFIKMAKKEKIRTIFVQPQFDRKAAGRIATAIKGSIVVLDPLAENYIYNLKSMAVKISNAL